MRRNDKTEVDLPVSYFCRLLAFSVLVGSAVSSFCHAAGQIPYGSRVGMAVTIKEMDGIDTEHASIKVEHTEANAKELCTEYKGDQSDACVTNTLKEVRVNDTLKGDCRTGQFVDLRGGRMTFAGANLDHDAVQYSPKYLISREGEQGFLDGSTASGYDVDLEQFKALCPAMFARAMGDLKLDLNSLDAGMRTAGKTSATRQMAPLTGY